MMHTAFTTTPSSVVVVVAHSPFVHHRHNLCSTTQRSSLIVCHPFSVRPSHDGWLCKPSSTSPCLVPVDDNNNNNNNTLTSFTMSSDPSSSSQTSQSDPSSSSPPQSLNNGFTLRFPSILTSKTSVLPSLVPLARFSWRSIWTILMSQLAPSDNNGNYIRPVSSMSKLDKLDNTNIEHDDQLILFVGYACPWCHRVQLALALARQLDEKRKLNNNVRTVIVQPGDNGLWRFTTTEEEDLDMATTGLDMNKMTYLKDLYLHIDPSYSGRFTAPLLYNSTTNKLISNESLQILNLLLPPFSSSSSSSSSSPQTDESKLCDTIHADINDGVYKVGFATSQQAYNLASDRLFHALDICENRLSQTNGFLLSDDMVSRTDVMLFPTVFRFDAVYAPLFRITRRSIANDYPLLGEWMRRMYHLNVDVKKSCGGLEMIVEHYFASLFPFNASGIVPQTKNVDLSPLS